MADDYECWLLSFCANEGDLKVIDLIQSNLPNSIKDKVRVYNYTGDIEELLSLMATFEMCVAAPIPMRILFLYY